MAIHNGGRIFIGIEYPMNYDYYKIKTSPTDNAYLRIDEQHTNVSCTWRNDETGETKSQVGGMRITDSGDLRIFELTPRHQLVQIINISSWDKITEEEYLRALEVL